MMQCFQNFHTLLQTDTDILHPICRVHLQTVLLDKLIGNLIRLVKVVKDAMAARLTTHHNILRYRKGGNQHKMLMHHANAVGDGRAGGEGLHFLTLHENLPGCWLIKAIQDFHQGRFSCTVFANQCKHFSLVYIKGYIIVRQHAWELHGYMLEGYNGGFRFAQAGTPRFLWHMNTEKGQQRPF